MISTCSPHNMKALTFRALPIGGGHFDARPSLLQCSFLILRSAVCSQNIEASSVCMFVLKARKVAFELS